MRNGTVILFSFVLAACSGKSLTESEAKAQLAELLSTRQYLVAASPLLASMANADVDFKVQQPPNDAYGVAMKRLLDQGFVSQQVHIESYPQISGSWNGEGTCVHGGGGSPARVLDYVLANQNSGCFTNKLTLELQPVADSDRVTGTWKWSILNGIVEGTLTTNDEIRIKFSTERISDFDGPQSADGRFLWIEKGERAYLVSPSGSFLYVGNATKRRTEVKRYSYTFANLRPAGDVIPVGKVQVQDVSQLLLTTETRATASFTWKAVLDKFGGAVLGNVTPPSGVSTAEFAKKPDGKWVLVAAPIPNGSL